MLGKEISVWRRLVSMVLFLYFFVGMAVVAGWGWQSIMDYFLPVELLELLDANRLKEGR